MKALKKKLGKAHNRERERKKKFSSPALLHSQGMQKRGKGERIPRRSEKLVSFPYKLAAYFIVGKLKNDFFFLPLLLFFYGRLSISTRSQKIENIFGSFNGGG